MAEGFGCGQPLLRAEPEQAAEQVSREVLVLAPVIELFLEVGLGGQEAMGIREGGRASRRSAGHPVRRLRTVTSLTVSDSASTLRSACLVSLHTHRCTPSHTVTSRGVHPALESACTLGMNTVLPRDCPMSVPRLWSEVSADMRKTSRRQCVFEGGCVTTRSPPTRRPTAFRAGRKSDSAASSRSRRSRKACNQPPPPQAQLEVRGHRDGPTARSARVDREWVRSGSPSALTRASAAAAAAEGSGGSGRQRAAVAYPGARGAHRRSMSSANMHPIDQLSMPGPYGFCDSPSSSSGARYHSVTTLFVILYACRSPVTPPATHQQHASRGCDRVASCTEQQEWRRGKAGR